MRIGGLIASLQCPALNQPKPQLFFFLLLLFHTNYNGAMGAAL